MFFDAAEPAALAAIQADAAALGFKMSSDDATGAMLRTLAASKPGGRLLETGTGVGVATSWLLDGMDSAARLVTVDREPRFQEIARRHLAADVRCEFVARDGAAFLTEQDLGSYDLIFADAWAGKYENLDETLALLKPGGVYFVDDLLPQPNWPPEHPPKVAKYIETMRGRDDLICSWLDFSTGWLIAAKR